VPSGAGREFLFAKTSCCRLENSSSVPRFSKNECQKRPRRWVVGIELGRAGVQVEGYTGSPELYPNNPTPRPLLTFILAESRHTRRIFKSTANRLGEEEFPAGPRRYSENRPRGPLPPFA